MSALTAVTTTLHEKGLRGTAAAVIHRVAGVLDRSTTPPPAPEVQDTWSDYLTWLTFAVPGGLTRGNVDSIDYVMANLTSDAPMLEIGSFCGLSPCVISYLAAKHGVSNRLFTCNRWDFGQEPDDRLDENAAITHNTYRAFVRDSFRRNVETFCADRLPYAIEAFSEEFFKRWRLWEKTVDVFGRSAELGGPISFCFIDGNRTYNMAKRDFENTDRFLVPGGFVLFDDSGDDTGWEVCRVVEEVKHSGRYRLIANNPNYLFQKIS